MSSCIAMFNSMENQWFWIQASLVYFVCVCVCVCVRACVRALISLV